MTSVYELKIGAEKLEVLLAIGEELTTLANMLNAAKEKLSQIANGNDDAQRSLAELKKEILAEQEKINAILSTANEQATQILSAAQTQAEQTAKLAKEATEQNAASAKSAQQKAAEILTSIEKLQEQIKATADKVENAGALLTELNSLREQIKTLLQNGIINDAAQSATQTYSSNLIEGKLATKASVGYGYSKIEANEKFNGLAQGINTAISAAAAAQSSAAGKLGKDEQAADSAKLGGSPANDYALKTQINTLETELANKLGKNEQAADSLKLGGLAADKYALKSEASDGLKIGSYLLWSSDRSTPAGFLPADGRRLQKSEYIELFDVIGYTYGGSGENFNLPKFNDGKFIRSAGGNAASLGISQGDAIRNIKGGFGDISGIYGEFHNPTGAFTNNQPRKKYNTGGWTEDNTGLGFDASRAVPVANENRPYNMSVIVLIKVKNVFEATNIDKSPYATEIKAGIVKLKNSITGNLSDTAVSEKAAKEYMDKNASIGIGQTWQDVKAQRQYNVTYTNTTGKPITVSVAIGGGVASFLVDGVAVTTTGSAWLAIFAVVPPNSTYKATRGSDGYWSELR